MSPSSGPAEISEAVRPFAGLDPALQSTLHLPAPGAPRARLDVSVETLSGVGPKLGAGLARLGIFTIRDLLEYRPRRYEAPAPRAQIAQLWAGQEATIEGEVVRADVRSTRRRRLKLVEARIRDGSGSIVATWFNQVWLADRLRPGTRVRLRGALERSEFVVRAYDLDGETETLRHAAIYPASEAIPVKRLRGLVGRVLPLARHLPDPLPAALRASLALPLKADALFALHRPDTPGQAERARRRLAFEELLVLQVGLLRRREEGEGGVAVALGPPGELAAAYRSVLPFTLTDGQERSIAEIDRDLARAAPMERLLQGDVGSGKTVVALYALLRAVERGHQGALMAPTETLAEQHFLTVEGICRELGVRCLLVTSSLTSREHAAALRALAAGEADIAVGTHALIQEAVEFHSLAVAVIDEQHRFGVEQRAALVRPVGDPGGGGVAGVQVGDPVGSGVAGVQVTDSAGDPARGRAAGKAPGGVVGRMRSPHRLHMTATPIPRTLALTVYGSLSVSEIDKLPAGRRAVITRWVTHERSAEAYTRLRRHLGEARQAFVVCPLVSPSEAIEAKAAEEEAERLRAHELAGFRVGCLHGQLRPAIRRAVMEEFARGELDVLVATTVIEVGVDVPNATIMIVQEADRFGLAQLHQLRGRVGRGAEQSYCLLVSRPREELTDAACERLEALVATGDGFALAEIDLELRGAGELLGTRQKGISDFKFTRLASDRELLEEARREARALIGDDGPLDGEVERAFGDANHRGLA